jgi:hypothetical protein
MAMLETVKHTQGQPAVSVVATCFMTLILSIVNKMKKRQLTVKHHLSEQVQKYGCFHHFPLGKIALVVRFLVEVLVTKKKKYFCSFPFSEGS